MDLEVLPVKDLLETEAGMSPRPGMTLTMGVAVPELDVEPVDTVEARGSMEAVVPELGVGLAAVAAAVESEASVFEVEEAVTWGSGAAEVLAAASETRSAGCVLDEAEDVVEAEPSPCKGALGAVRSGDDGEMRFASASASLSRPTPAAAAAVVDSVAMMAEAGCKDGDNACLLLFVSEDDDDDE